MQEAFHLGGWGMYPTTIAGLVLLFSSMQYARDPEATRLRVVRSLGTLTMLASVLGFVTGVIKSFLAVPSAPHDDAGTIVIVGVGESLTNIGLGLVLLVLSTLLVTVGAFRAKPVASAVLVDPRRP